MRPRAAPSVHGSSTITTPEKLRATHYSWEVCKDPAAREAELLREHEQRFGRPPRYNESNAA